MDFKPLPLAFGAALLAALAQAATPVDETPVLASAPVAVLGAAPLAPYDAVVEAVRQTVVSAQVAGAVIALPVKAGDRVRRGQLLVRLDARSATQQASAAAAQVQAARAAEQAAAREFERQKQLFQKNYISQAALDRAEAQYQAAQAGLAAQLATAGAARSDSALYTLVAPYDAVVSEVPVVIGDMALPGRPLVTLHDPGALRVTAAIPVSAVPRAGAAPLVELAGATPARIAPVRWQVLPAADPATHTVQLRLDLPPGTAAAPGMFARAWLPGASAEAPRVAVPARAVVRRAELTAVYVIGADGRPLLRQVRLGPAHGDQVEVLSGVAAGERVALDPQAAARVR